MDRLLTRKEVAGLLRLKPQTLAAWVTNGTGPKLTLVKVTGRVLYRESEIRAIIEGESSQSKVAS